MSQISMEIPKELLDWDEPFTAEQLKYIVEEFGSGTLVETLDELIETVRIADEWIAEENSTHPGAYMDIVINEYTRDAFACVAGAVLSAKNLRSEIERITGPEDAKFFYQDLVNAFKFFETENDGYSILRPDWPVPVDRHDSTAQGLAQLIEIQRDSYSKEAECDVGLLSECVSASSGTDQTAVRQPEPSGATPSAGVRKRRHGKGELNRRVKNLLATEDQNITSGEIAERIKEASGIKTSAASVRQTDAWKKRDNK